MQHIDLTVHESEHRVIKFDFVESELLSKGVGTSALFLE